MVFSNQNGVSFKLLNMIMVSQRHNACNVFENKNIDVMNSPGCNAFRVLSDKQIRAHFKYCQVKTHIQTAHGLNMDLCSFDTNSMLELQFIDFKLCMALYHSQKRSHMINTV